MRIQRLQHERAGDSRAIIRDIEQEPGSRCADDPAEVAPREQQVEPRLTRLTQCLHFMIAGRAIGQPLYYSIAVLMPGSEVVLLHHQGETRRLFNLPPQVE